MSMFSVSAIRSVEEEVWDESSQTGQAAMLSCRNQEGFLN